MEYYSHIKPKRYLLIEHLFAVAKRSKVIVESKSFDFIDKNVLANISFLIGISHDFGKYTTFFQNKLNGFLIEDRYLANHSFISALFGFELIKEYLSNINKIKLPQFKTIPLITYFVIKHHHGNLNNIDDDVNPARIFESFKRVNKQIQDIFENKNKIFSDFKTYPEIDFGLVNAAFNNLNKYNIKIEHSDEIPNLIIELDKASYQLNLENTNTKIYFITQFLYSILIDSDKKHAGNVREIKRKNLPDNLVDIHLNSSDFKKKNKSNLNKIRKAIYNSVTTNIIKDENLNQKIFTITAPTGTGKTLTSFSAALKLRNKLAKCLHTENEFRIIYALPFTSIIDQSYTVFDDVLNHLENFKGNENEFLLKHHHLSEVIYKSNESNKEIEVDESLALIESWESEIIVTTFIQFFYAVIGYKNRSLKKFHNIVNSIIILDEVQNIPIKYWKLLNVVLHDFAEYFNSRIILMTATKPLIFSKNEFIELVDDYEKYFKLDELNRVSLNIDFNKQTIEEFADKINFQNYDSYLFVFNTIGSAEAFYQLLNRKIKNKKTEIIFLSTNIVPKERNARIGKIKSILEEIRKDKSNFNKLIVVSTQLIEAGVDIDCDVVYRDRGPLDSVIQVAGRCNRNKRYEISKVNLIALVNERDKYFSNYIYDPELLFVLNKILEGKNEIQEKEFLNIINNYFTLVRQKVAQEENIIGSIIRLNFDKHNGGRELNTISSFRLITKDYPTIDIFIELDDGNAEKIWSKYEAISENKNLTGLEKRNEFLKIRKEFNDYIISIPERTAPPGFEKGIINYVSLQEVKKEIYYLHETGFKRNNAGSGVLDPAQGD